MPPVLRLPRCRIVAHFESRCQTLRGNRRDESRPRRALENLLEDPHKIGYAALVYLFLGVIYTISVQAAFMRGFGAQVTPFLAIPAERYYFWQRFYQIPFFFFTNVLFAGTARLLALAWSLFNILRQVAGVVWPLVIIVGGLKLSARIGGLSAAIVTVAAFLPTGALMVVFIR